MSYLYRAFMGSGQRNGVVLTGYEKSQKWGFDPHWRERR
jgi:hypothetical protein